MRELELSFIGKGQVKGFKFTQIKKTNLGLFMRLRIAVKFITKFLNQKKTSGLIACLIRQIKRLEFGLGLLKANAKQGIS